ncbi:MAG: efflux RND transporter periplasmic adaptor subunit [Candidatus Binatia bacterium]
MSKRLLLLLLVGFVVALVGSAVYWRGELGSGMRHDSSTAHTKGVYQCAMHPQIVSDEPGVCPICQMKLQRVDESVSPGAMAGATSTETQSGEKKVTFYRHPMRADVVSPVPAKDEMGMAYIPVYDDNSADGGDSVPGHASFTLSRERQQIIGVTRGRASVRPLSIDVRAAGRVAYDPKLYQAIVEYREAARSRSALGPTARDEAQSGGNALVRGAYLRLRQQGFSDEQIHELTRGTRDPVELLLPSESVWVYAQVYEYEAPLIRVGQTMSVTVPSQPGREFVAKVAAVDAVLDPTTRTVRVRGLVPTPDRSLRPESFVQVTIRVPLGEKLSVLSEAVLDTGAHQIVFVVTGEGRFAPRSVILGRTAEGYVEVMSGLSEGEEVVTSANFLIDSESRFRAAVASFKGARETPR